MVQYRGMLTGMLRRRVGLQVVRAFARQRLRRVGLVGIPRTEIDGWRERQQRDRTLARVEGFRRARPAVGRTGLCG